ncbi:MAG TPA: hypothetical protein DDZ51_31325 [Planctomycetaceae bacterium]|nr:hypothetical protein [Planctomycetaceae bacterium]
MLAKLWSQNEPLFARIIAEPCVVFYTVNLATTPSKELKTIQSKLGPNYDHNSAGNKQAPLSSP